MGKFMYAASIKTVGDRVDLESISAMVTVGLRF